MSLPESFLEAKKSKNANNSLGLKIFFGLGLICFFLSILMYLYYLKEEDNVEIIKTNEQVMGTNEEIINENKGILVDISGAVREPGIYELEEGSRVNEAVTRAGGFGEKINKEWVQKNLNLAAKLNDGQKIYIPFESEEISNNSNNSSNNLELINVNTASKEELKNLQGIGEVTAKEIVNYRDKNGNFKDLVDLEKVPGLGEKTIDKFKEQISF